MNGINELEEEIQEHRNAIKRLEYEISRLPELRIREIFSRLYTGYIKVTMNWSSSRKHHYIEFNNATRNTINGNDLITETETTKLLNLGLIVSTVGKNYILLREK